MFRSPNVESMTTTKTRILNSMFFIPWAPCFLEMPKPAHHALYNIPQKLTFCFPSKKPLASHAKGKRCLSATKELDSPIRMQGGFYSVFTSACDAYILSFHFLAISARCNWKMQTSERWEGLLPQPSAYGNVDLADGVCGYLCMSNFAFLWLRNIPRWQLECVCVVCAQ